MNIIITNSNNTPIYEQIYDEIKTKIISGELKSGQMLPSIRNLAKDLKISVITTKRAYDELLKDGYITVVVGKGTFVAEKNIEIIKEARLKEIEELMGKILKLSKACNLETLDILEMFKIISEEE